MKATLTITIDYPGADGQENAIDLMLGMAAENLADNGLLSGDFETGDISHDVEFGEEEAPAPLLAQFAQLLTKLDGVINLDKGQWRELAHSMDLEIADVEELFNQAMPTPKPKKIKVEDLKALWKDYIDTNTFYEDNSIGDLLMGNLHNETDDIFELIQTNLTDPTVKLIRDELNKRGLAVANYHDVDISAVNQNGYQVGEGGGFAEYHVYNSAEVVEHYKDSAWLGMTTMEAIEAHTTRFEDYYLR